MCIRDSSTHIASAMMNYMGYNAGNMGNHDVEAGHAVFDRWIKQCDFPILGANIIRTSDRETYLKPYEVFERDGVKIVVLGLSLIHIWVRLRMYMGSIIFVNRSIWRWFLPGLSSMFPPITVINYM